jgi:hypothetical protein
MAKKKNGTPEAPAEGAAPQEPAKNRPVKEVRLGRIKASVWSNTNSKQEQWYSCVLTRSYKDAQGEWKSSHSLGLDDLLVAGEVLRLAALWIYAERQGQHAPQQQPQREPGEEAPVQDIPF